MSHVDRDGILANDIMMRRHAFRCACGHMRGRLARSSSWICARCCRASTVGDTITAADGVDKTTIWAREAALVEDARQDPAAFAHLYELYFARVFRYLRLRVEHESDAEDLAQQVFLRALNALPRYQARAIGRMALHYRAARARRS
jgi:hypothetical protein